MNKLHDADPRKSKEFWCSDCKSTHTPTEEHPICDAEKYPHLHQKPPSDIFFIYKGWKFTAPFHCMYCGIEVCYKQWAFGRACGGCDVGNSHTAKLHYFQWTAGPHEIVDRNDPYFMKEDAFVPLEEVQKRNPINPPMKPFESFKKMMDDDVPSDG